VDASVRVSTFEEFINRWNDFMLYESRTTLGSSARIFQLMLADAESKSSRKTLLSIGRRHGPFLPNAQTYD
jgi:hypothetical protein